MREFDLHSSGLNLDCESLFALWCFQFITLLLQNVSLKAADPVVVRVERRNPHGRPSFLSLGTPPYFLSLSFQ